MRLDAGRVEMQTISSPSVTVLVTTPGTRPPETHDLDNAPQSKCDRMTAISRVCVLEREERACDHLPGAPLPSQRGQAISVTVFFISRLSGMQTLERHDLKTRILWLSLWQLVIKQVS